MGRYQEGRAGGTSDPIVNSKTKQQAKDEANLESGRCIYMRNPDGTLVLVENTDKSIRRKLTQGFTKVEMVEKTVTVPSEPARKPKVATRKRRTRSTAEE